MHSNKYTLIYAAVLSVLTAVILAVTAEGLKPAQQANVILDTKANILKAVRLDLTERQQIEQTYESRIREVVLNVSGEELEGVDAKDIDMKEETDKDWKERRLPLYVYTAPEGDKNYIIPVRGVGLWGPIWGYISLEGDFNTIYGAYFDHKGETPGLGAEIAEKPFQDQFRGKKIMSEDGQFVSVNVIKKTDKLEYGEMYRVDAISGGTITSQGTNDMIKEGLEPYLTYFKKNKSNNLISEYRK
ncbi:NADH:ubiquinone reductase (Na(+)-transporting) subunit C [Telluribacter humicola]|uniref:NADH:ubiquinone reductase (Na(+)-transporting) subunit C n=1 Tax=Telluribacter humicola TaxID=1720261 RepID=UPI001A97819C|nr:NADH:ubiquinone reductase (Na(+)-transporting) subunit C [Telluribacter humicola]